MFNNEQKNFSRSVIVASLRKGWFFSVVYPVDVILGRSTIFSSIPVMIDRKITIQASPQVMPVSRLSFEEDRSFKRRRKHFSN